MRVSTGEQRLGPQAQRESLKRWCAGNRIRLVAVFTDDGVSGGTAMEQRPGLIAALKAIRNLRAAVLLVARRDRLARERWLG